MLSGGFGGLFLEADLPWERTGVDCNGAQETMSRVVSAPGESEQEQRLADFEGLVAMEGAALLRLARRLLGDADEAEDLLQDALLKAYRALPAFRGESAFKTWVWRIVVREGLKKIRRRKLKNKVAGWFKSVEAPPAGLGLGRAKMPESLAHQRQQLEILQGAMEKLPERQRAALVLRYFEGMGVAEIAEVLEIGSGTVKTHLVRALRQVRSAWPAEEQRDGVS